MNSALIVPVLKRFDLFTDMIKSIDCEIKPYIVDNYNNNRGVAASWNLGIVRARKDGYRYAVISNDDVVFVKGTIEKLYKSINTTGACIISANQENYINNKGLIKYEDMVDLCKNLDFYADFSCFIVDIPQLIKKCGYFDENFSPAYFEDDDMRYRMKLAGVQHFIDTDAPIQHLGSQTQNYDPRNPVVTPDMFNKNKNYYVNKWGNLKGKETYTTPFGNPKLTIKEW
jgi:GT2 family glycosyltransferase